MNQLYKNGTYSISAEKQHNRHIYLIWKCNLIWKRKNKSYKALKTCKTYATAKQHVDALATCERTLKQFRLTRSKERAF